MGNSFTDDLAADVRSRRGALRLSQRDLAELAGVSERFVRFVEQGKRTVQLDSLLALLETLGLELRVQTRTSAAARALAGPQTSGEIGTSEEIGAGGEQASTESRANTESTTTTEPTANREPPARGKQPNGMEARP